MSEKKICPIMSWRCGDNSVNPRVCQREKCALWVEKIEHVENQSIGGDRYLRHNLSYCGLIKE